MFVIFLSLSLSSPLPALSPTFIQPPDNLTVDEGATFFINCSATGFPEPMISLKPMKLDFVFSDRGNGVFRFTDADPVFSPGQYYCEATNHHGVARSHDFTISVVCES